MAIAIPPMLMVFMVSPIMFSTSIVIISESGIVTSDIAVMRRFIRKSSRMRMTNRAPSYSDFWMLSMELSMKSD